MGKRIILVNLSFMLACAVLITALQTRVYADASFQQQTANNSKTSASGQPTVAIFRFAVQSEMAERAAASSQVCSQYMGGANSSAGSTEPDKLTVDPKILDAISVELQKALSKKMSVMVGPDPNTIPVGSFIVCGRIFDATKGSALARMVGLGLGASRLKAHVAFLLKTERGFSVIDSFDLKLKGRNLFPPGASTAVFQAAIMERRQNLQGLAKKLANQVVKRLDSNLKRPELAAKRR